MKKPSGAKEAQTREVLTQDDIYQFLPAAIEVEQTPASPAGRAIIWAIVTLFMLAALWAFFGKVDIVAVASGKIIPSEHIKQIQPLEAGKIKQIHVREGQQVKQGDPLITLDAIQTAADEERLRHELQDRHATETRLKAFEHWLANDYPSDVNADATAMSSSQYNLLSQQRMEFTARLNALKNEQMRQRAEQEMTQAEINKKKRIIPVLSERVGALNTLRKKEYASRLQYLELKQELIEEEQDLLIQKARYKQLNASVQLTQNQIDTLTSEQRKNNLTQLQDTQLQIAGVEQELIKATERNQQQQLISPISGQVQQLAVHTIGGVVTPAQALMVIVPKQSQVEMDALILNKDIGFVHEGQKAAVKIDTFNFTKYGLIDAEILTLSDDAIQDENLGLVYSARIKLHQDGLQIDDRWVKLSPGMSATSEIKTGKRRLIEYFLSPLLRYKQESVRER
ncbi:HlyD family type I secretion periplasmic adaptor subunit [Neptunomonas japonica]|uniref:HlyD family type I secretion periplasmic adaptor subunit n=1 Tax=Neptunomonas japonica TaxID=417574 RepID=UPI0003FE9011|nr:HlyD family type I secretion periplasmic adaptor subunit [Neptunomonas japonica]